MNLLNQAAELGGVKITTGTYVNLETIETKTMWMSYLRQAEQRILDERTRRRTNLREVATVLVLAQKIEADTVAQINLAFDKADGIDKKNQLVNEDHYADKTTYDVFSPFKTPMKKVSTGYQRMYVKSAGTSTELGEFMIKHGAYAYSKKLKSIGDLIAGTQMSITFGASMSVDLATLSSIEFINSTAFDRYNATYSDLIDQAMDSAKDEVEEASV